VREPSAVTTEPLMQPGKGRHHPIVVEKQAQRAADIQLRVAHWITAFAGSMPFVYLHVALFAIWMSLFESRPGRC
jgi:uncharacterized membrane protein